MVEQCLPKLPISLCSSCSLCLHQCCQHDLAHLATPPVTHLTVPVVSCGSLPALAPHILIIRSVDIRSVEGKKCQKTTMSDGPYRRNGRRKLLSTEKIWLSVHTLTL